MAQAVKFPESIFMNYLLRAETDFVIRAACNAVVRYRRLRLFRRRGRLGGMEAQNFSRKTKKMLTF